MNCCWKLYHNTNEYNKFKNYAEFVYSILVPFSFSGAIVVDGVSLDGPKFCLLIENWGFNLLACFNGEAAVDESTVAAKDAAFVLLLLFADDFPVTVLHPSSSSRIGGTIDGVVSGTLSLMPAILNLAI